jgi:hypothetical protein
VIWSRFKIVLLIWPIFLLLGFWGNSSFQRHEIDKKLPNADGLVWKAGEKQFMVKVNPHEDGELLEIGIKIIDPDRKIVYEKTEKIDRDMFGGGFIRAVQVDQDFEDEIVVWHARAKYYLDFSEGNVIEVSFDQVPQHIKDLAQNWHKYNVIAGVEMTLLLIVILSYYILYFLIKETVRLFNRKKFTD